MHQPAAGGPRPACILAAGTRPRPVPPVLAASSRQSAPDALEHHYIRRLASPPPLPNEPSCLRAYVFRPKWPRYEVFGRLCRKRRPRGTGRRHGVHLGNLDAPTTPPSPHPAPHHGPHRPATSGSLPPAPATSPPEPLRPDEARPGPEPLRPDEARPGSEPLHRGAALAGRARRTWRGACGAARGARGAGRTGSMGSDAPVFLFTYLPRPPTMAQPAAAIPLSQQPPFPSASRHHSPQPAAAFPLSQQPPRSTEAPSHDPCPRAP
jgi:hypothetical protein